MIVNGNNLFTELSYRSNDTMDLSFRTKEHREADKKRVEMFCERYASSFVRADPEEVIMKWLEFQYARYQINEVEDGFYINDFEEKKLVAFISKDDPRAFVHTFELCEKLNEPIEEPFLSSNGRELSIMTSNSLVELKDNSIVDFLIDNIEKEK